MNCVQRKIHVLHGELFSVEESWRDALAAIGISSDSDWTGVVGNELVSMSPSVRCYRCDLAARPTVYFKRYVYARKKWHEFFLRPAKPAVEFWAYSRLKELGIPTLEVIAFAERRWLGAVLAGCIVTRGVPDTLDLEDFVRTVWRHWPRPRRLETARAIGRTLLSQARVAHENAFFHHDLKWRNILIKPTGESESLVWIDAPRASRMRFRHQRGVITDLSGLARIAISLFSRFELMRFVHGYLGEGHSSDQAKRLFRQVAQHLGRRMPQAVELDFPD